MSNDSPEPQPPQTATAESVDAKPSRGVSAELTRSQRLGVWAGVIGATIGSTAWLIAMAILSHDWLTVAITLALDVVVAFLFGRLCLRHAKSRFLLLGLMLVILTAHCLAMYWWRLDLWRTELPTATAELQSQKKVVTITVSAMVAIVLAQMLVMHWLQNKARRIR